MRFLAICSVLCLTAPAWAQPKDVPTTTRELIAEANRRVSEGFPTAEFQDKIPFATFLRMLEKEISKEKPFAIQLDHEAFGKDADRMLKAEVSMAPVAGRMTFHLAIRLALSQARGEVDQEIEFTGKPDAFVITTRDRSLFTASYEIGTLLKHTRELHESLPKDGKISGVFFLIGPEPPGYDMKADPNKPSEWMVRQLMALTSAERAGWHGRTPASTLRVVNGTKLVVHTTPSVHDEISQVLASWRRLVDLAIIMNAKVYALERAEFDKFFAASFVDPKDKLPRLAATITNAQAKMLHGRKPIFASDADKLRPSARAAFLSHKNVYQYKARPGAADLETAFEGFSFAVRPSVSPDRRCLRLEFFHDVEQLIKLTKGMMIDPKTGKELPIELPNLRRSAGSGTVEIHDGEPIILAVDYRLKDKVWLVVAEPRIYIAEEEERLRNAAIKPMPLADEKPAPGETDEQDPIPPPPPAVQLPDSDELKQILQSIVQTVLTDRKIKSTRDFYGTPGEQKFALDNDSRFLWPKSFRPAVAGFAEERFKPGECVSFRKRLMGIRIDAFDLEALKAGKEFSIDVALHNVGGSVNGGVIGGCHVTFVAKRDGKRWSVTWTELFDP